MEPLHLAVLVRRCRLREPVRDPVWRQILSNSTSPPLPEPVGELLPVVGEDLLRHPNRASACANARHTARPVARSTTDAITQNREWSSTPVTTFASRSTPVRGVDQLDPADDVDAPQLHRTRPLAPSNESRGRFRGRGCASPCRCRIRFTVRSDGGSTLDRPWRPRNSSIRIRFAPHRGCLRRISATATSTPADLMRTRHRSMRPVRQPGHRPTRYRPIHRCNVDRCTRFGGDLDHARPRQHRPNRVQPLPDNRQHDQRQSRPPDPHDAPRRRQRTQDRRIRPTLSRITWRRTVAHHPAQDTGPSGCTAESGSCRSRPGASAGRRRVSSLRCGPRRQNRISGPPGRRMRHRIVLCVVGVDA